MRAAVAGGGKRRRVGQLRDALRPPLPGGDAGRLRPRLLRLDGVPVLPVGVAQCRQVVTEVQGGQVGHQGAIAHRVGGLHVQVDVQARTSAGQPRQCELEHRTVELLVRFGVADGRQPLIDLIAVQVAQVLDRDRECVAHPGRRDALGAVGQEPHPQHRMAPGQRRGRRAQALGIERATVEFDVEVSGHPAELQVVLAADPHRVLHRGQREWFARRVLRLGGWGLLVGDFGRRVGGYQLGPGLDGRSGGQCGEIDGDALAAPAPRQGHDPDGVQALADEVGTWVDVFDIDAEQFGYLCPDVFRARRGTHHEPSLN